MGAKLLGLRIVGPALIKVFQKDFASPQRKRKNGKASCHHQNGSKIVYRIPTESFFHI